MIYSSSVSDIALEYGRLFVKVIIVGYVVENLNCKTFAFSSQV